MSNLVTEFIGLLNAERRTLDALRERLRSERRAFVAARSDMLEQALESLSANDAKRAAERTNLLRAFGRLAASVGIDLTVATVGLVAKKLPKETAARLLDAAALARRAAESTRVELTVGERLLGFANEFKDSMLRSVLGAQPGGPPVYGRTGRQEEDAERPTLSLMDARC